VPPRLAQDVRVVRVEDGFLRSVGLGTELYSPCPGDGRPGNLLRRESASDLEHVLQTFDFTPHWLHVQRVYGRASLRRE